MKRTATTLLALLVASVCLASTSHAALRVPQVPVGGVGLQNYLNSVGEAINVNTDQDATQTWSHTSSGTAAFTLMLQTSNINANLFGLYNGSDAVVGVRPVIASGRSADAFSTVTFQPGGNIVVNHFDENGIFMFSVPFAGVDATNVGFALEITGTAVYLTQDFRNAGGQARALAYRGTGANAGTWWLCWEDGTDNDFDDTVILMESVNPTPVSRSSWGTLKARCR